MPRQITAEFDIRREAELAVEHLVQEYNVDRSAVEVIAAGDDNTAGVAPSGADIDGATGQPGSSPARGMIRVTATVDDAIAEKAEEALREARGV